MKRLGDRRYGKLRWRQTVQGSYPYGRAVRVGVHSEIALLVAVYQGISTNVHIVAIQTQSPGLAPSPWPTYCANNAKTCNDTLP
ncbi:MAG: hypothetical protein KAI47_02630 [Deltaproteobacteria bacterium]|nr:hypothetical protein [Deltaproteobacteria bacterium]